VEFPLPLTFQLASAPGLCFISEKEPVIRRKHNYCYVLWLCTAVTMHSFLQIIGASLGGAGTAGSPGMQC
jgi:hypothetical protein